jgi:hypothetical protein
MLDTGRFQYAVFGNCSAGVGSTSALVSFFGGALN